MILQSLNSYYQRLTQMEDSDVAPEGFAPQLISFALQIGEQGELLDVIDMREPMDKGKKLVARKMIVPDLGEAKGNAVKATYLWGNPGYVLGRDDKGKPKRTEDCRVSFRRLHEGFLNSLDILEAKALLRFLESPAANDPKIEEKWENMASANLVFRVGQKYLHEIPALQAVWHSKPQDIEEASEGVCLITGDRASIARLHAPIKGVIGAPATGAALCSYNLRAFTSFGKEQNRNGPIGKMAASGYTTALNYLLAHPAQKLRLGAATVICWAERSSPLENNQFALLSGTASKASPDSEADTKTAQERAAVLRRLGQGLPITQAWPEFDPEVCIYILALKPSTSRLSVSFFLHGSARNFLERVREYYSNLAIARRFDNEPEFPIVWEIARAVLGRHKETGDVQRLGEDLLKAALSDQAYPAYLLPMCLQRLRSGDDTTSVRAGLIKAMLLRNYAHKEELMSLNSNHPSPAYQLGRLFALLVGVQRKAIGQHINADIRDKYYGAASATPAMVFPLLLRNAQNHISKAKAGGYDKLIRDVLDRINDEFPLHLNLQDQGLFALGYYHQRAEKSVKQEEDAQI
jgi:CRISPR-associated protein Csd1